MTNLTIQQKRQRRGIITMALMFFAFFYIFYWAYIDLIPDDLSVLSFDGKEQT